MDLCKATTKAGKPCRYRGRVDGYCRVHLKLRDADDCPICYESVTPGTSTTTRCNHVFHSTCLQRWMEVKTTCPMCRDDIRPTTGSLRPSNGPHIIYVDSHEQLLPFLNAPVEIRFTANYWESVSR